MKRTKLILILVGLVIAFLLILGGMYVSGLVIQDLQIRGAENQIKQAQIEYNRCVIVMDNSHKQAEEARQTILDIKGTGDFILPQSQSQGQKLSDGLTLSGPNIIQP